MGCWCLVSASTVTYKSRRKFHSKLERWGAFSASWRMQSTVIRVTEDSDDWHTAPHIRLTPWQCRSGAVDGGQHRCKLH
eukprot:555228-Rhodomonas_salina.1